MVVFRRRGRASKRLRGLRRIDTCNQAGVGRLRQYLVGIECREPSFIVL